MARAPFKLDTMHPPPATTSTPDRTTFRLWAPTARRVELVDLTRASTPRTHAMRRDEEGGWSLTLPGDREGTVYRFRRHGEDGRVVEFTDPHAVSVTANGRAGVVKRLTPWRGTRPPAVEPGAEIIYEAHIRDLTIHPGNGITRKGAFLGLTETGTRTPRGTPTGLDHLRSLGVTHVQLLPVFDFATVDETGDLGFNAQYNWGYDPQNYNAPEGSYSSDPHDPDARIDELRRLVDTLHDHGLRVIMDVVYNHVYDARTHPLALAEPDAYFRRGADGEFLDATGCGTETASEHPRMNEYIVNSVRHWATTYGIDGFRFDLMGIHDTVTMREVRRMLDEIDPTILVLGEGWVMGNHPAGVSPADLDHAPELPGIAMFNDSLRDVVRGDNFRAAVPGFATGAGGRDEARLLYDNLTGAGQVKNFATPAQSLNYTEVHDNLTLFDKISAVLQARGPVADEEIVRRHQLALTIPYLAPGRVFLHAGQEFLRTKNGDDNSYTSPDSVNALDYDRADTYAGTVELVRQLNAFRRAHPWTRLTDYAEIIARHELITCDSGLIAYRVRGAEHTDGDVWVVVNARRQSVPIDEVTGKSQAWAALIFDHRVHPEPVPVPDAAVPELSVAVLVAGAGAQGGRQR